MDRSLPPPHATGDAVIEVHQLAKRFGDVDAVRDVSFVAPDGQVTGVLGPNGAGKTTVMRMIAGLLRPDTGAVRLHLPGTNVAATSPLTARPTSTPPPHPAMDAVAETLDVHGDPLATRRARHLFGVLPDAHGLYPRLTAREHLQYFGALHKVPPDALNARINRLSARLAMGDIIDRRVAGFSQGERMKVALARALVHDPPFVLLDEPTNGLDVMSTRAVRAMVRGLRDDGRCVIFSSHIMQEIEALCDRIVVVVGGRVALSGSAGELMAATATHTLEDAFVACMQRSSALDGSP